MKTLKKDKKIFFFDIDGTLAMGYHIPKSTKVALQKLKDAGHLIFICTGRVYEYAQEYFGAYVDGFITSNGRYIQYKDDVLLDEPLTQQQIRYFIDVMRKHDCGFGFLDHHHGYLESHDPKTLQKAIDHYLPGYYYTDFQDEDVHGYMFDIYFPDHQHFQRIQEELKETVIFNEHFPDYSADATILGVDKGIGIDRVLEYFSIDKSNAFAFGDGANDLCMFAHVGHPVAMGNAIPLLKENAEYITTDIDKDGIFHALKHYQIIEK